MRNVVKLVLGIVLFGFVSVCSSLAGAQEVSVPGGYATQEHEVNIGGGFDYLPNGDGIAINYDFSSPPVVYIVDLNGDDNPASPQTVATLPTGTFGSSLKVSPDGTFAVFGTTGSTYSIYKIDLTTYEVTKLADIRGNQSIIFYDWTSILVSANQSSNPSRPNQVIWVDINNPTDQRVLAEVYDTPSGGIERNSAGDLYYIKSTWTFPAPADSHRLIKFSASQIKSALENGTILTEADSLLNISLDGGYDLAINAFNDILISQLDGQIFKIDEKNGTKEFFGSVPQVNVDSFSHIVFNDPKEFFDPFHPSAAKLGISYSKNYYTSSVLLEIIPAADDSFADEVLSFFPGAGGSGDPQLVLGPPTGGGTFNPDISSIVLLGDRDNPTTNSPATIDVKFDKAIEDAADNLHGLDLIVFSNSFWSGDGEHNRFTEPALIEVSQDFNHNGISDDEWFLVLPNILPDDLGPLNPVEYDSMTLRNYAEYSPTLLLGDLNGDNEIDVPDMEPEDFYTVPDRLTFEGDDQSYLVDANSGGGDAIDLRDAVVQTSAGVPYVDALGRMHYAYLDQVDFVRLRDARYGDGHAVVGPVTAEIDAVADAKANLKGESFSVTTVSELESALGNAQAGDEIFLNPGTYILQTPVYLPVGVSLKGSEGLWTVNDPGDDTVIDGQNLPEKTAAVNLTGESISLEEGYSISGIHFKDCPKGIYVNGFSPTIENNFFTDVQIAIHLENSSQQTTLIRHNVLGHRRSMIPTVGAYAKDSRVAFEHNTFVNYRLAGIILGQGSESYLRDNIFWKNKLAIGAKHTDYLYGSNNVFYQNTQNYNLNSSSLLENDILAEPSFAAIPMGDYRLNINSSIRGNGMGGSDPGVYDGSNFLPFDIKSR